MSGLLSVADFDRLRSDAATRRDALVKNIETLIRAAEEARAELAAVDEFLSRLEVTEQYLGSANSPLDISVSNSVRGVPQSELSLPSMVSHVLQLNLQRASDGERCEGLKPSEIAAEIGRLFNQTVHRKAVNGHLWYLFSKHRVQKRGMRYFLPKPFAASRISEGVTIDLQ